MELARENILDYLRGRTSEIGVFSTETELDIEEIGDGNLNFVFRVFDVNQPSHSIVLKQAPPYIKILGPSYELTPERLTYESRALEIYNQLAPEYSPRQIDFDPHNHALVMEDLKGYQILRSSLIDGHVNPQIAENIARFMACTHSRTHAENLSQEAAQTYDARFANRVMQGITADYVFTKPFHNDPTNFYTDGLEPYVNGLQSDVQLLSGIAALKETFLNSKQGLTHGDLHTGSVMVQGDATKVIDAEFVFYGPVGFDIGLYWANYFLSYFSHTGNLSVCNALKNSVEDMWQLYETAFEMDNPGKKAEVLDSIFHESIGFAGLEMMRRLIGAAHVKDIEGITDVERKLAVEIEALEFGRRLVKNHNQFKTISDFPFV